MRKRRGLPPNSLLEETEPTHERLFAPMGETLLFQTNDLALLQAAEESFGRFASAAPSGRPPLLIRLFTHGVSDQPRPRPLYRTQRHLFYISAGAANTAVADLVKGEAFGFMSPEVAADPLYLRVTFVESLGLILLTTARSFIPLHAAAVTKNGVSFILHGRAGAGKSTLAYACARRGYRVVAEDGLLVKSPPEGMRLWGLPWSLHLLPDAKRFFPELRDEQPRLQLNDEWKLELDLEKLRPGSTATDAAPGWVLFLERNSAARGTQLEPLTLAEAQQALEVVWPWALEWTGEREDGVRQLLEHRAYRVIIGGAPDQTVDALDELVARGLAQRELGQGGS